MGADARLISLSNRESAHSCAGVPRMRPDRDFVNSGVDACGIARGARRMSFAIVPVHAQKRADGSCCMQECARLVRTRRCSVEDTRSVSGRAETPGTRHSAEGRHPSISQTTPCLCIGPSVFQTRTYRGSCLAGPWVHWAWCVCPEAQPSSRLHVAAQRSCEGSLQEIFIAPKSRSGFGGRKIPQGDRCQMGTSSHCGLLAS